MHIADAHVRSIDEVTEGLESSHEGISPGEARARLEREGPNSLPHGKPVTLPVVILHQFINPLIYVLMVAAAVSAFLGEYSDAGFILAVLLINAAIGTVQEYNAERSAEALRGFFQLRAFVLRGGEEYEVNAEELVPGDLVLLESGVKVPADLRLIGATNLEIDESLLTGESVAVSKDANARLEADTPLGDRANMAYAGSLVTRGRAQGLVVATGLDTELGHIAASVTGARSSKPPLLTRMERFTKRIAMAVGVVIVLMAGIEFARGASPHEVFVVAVALAVSAIPEGLPVALTVALAIGVSRMSKRNVIVRKLVAVEALGSCTYIASDKTGTLTMNELTVRRIALPGRSVFEISGEGLSGEGHLTHEGKAVLGQERDQAEDLALAGALCNEGFFGKRDGSWSAHGDAVDVALLVYAHKLGMTRIAAEDACPQLAQIPFESDRQFAASLHRRGGVPTAFVKGALERVLAMCTTMAGADGTELIAQPGIEEQARALAAEGYKVIALAAGEMEGLEPDAFGVDDLNELRFLGLVGIIDPLRPEAREAVRECHRAGIEVAMVTGDHPLTAFAISRELGLAEDFSHVVTGTELRTASEQGNEALDRLVDGARVFARVEPRQKTDVVESLRRLGHFVAVTGD
ncbi:MAG: HAD-IC family P-type ATPase, partial [Chrysiogenetes bacterium]|nr:HAD-IC family P-type ATPase [Chrysiogenetes bacterium]